MLADTEPCPGEPELRAFHHGDCDEEALERIAAHLEGCELCSERLGRLEAEDDPVFAALRHRPCVDIPRTLGRPAMPRPPRPFTAPAGYEIVGSLGSGGMSEVFRARQLRLGRSVALKRLKTDSLFDLDRFRREALAVAALQHPNVIQIYEFGDHEGQPYLALEYADGGSLAEHLKTRRVPPREAAALVALLAGAVEHAHRRGVIHRDLKPANILLVASGTGTPPTAGSAAPCESTLAGLIPKVADFGIARRMEGIGEVAEAGMTRTGSILGTPSYMAPEQAAGKKAGPPADIHALGAILYELLVERPPFQGDETFETLRQVIHEDPIPPARLRPGLPRDLETICLKCLRKDPARRYGSAAELEADLGRYLEGRPIQARPTSTVELAWRWARRHPATASAIAVAQLALVVLAISVSWYNERIRQALVSTRAAEQQAEQNARLAIQAHQQLIGQVQDLLRENAATRPLRAALLETALSGLQRIAAADASSPLMSRAVAHQLLGQVHWELGHTDEAIDETQRCLQVVDALLGRPGTPPEAWGIRSSGARSLGGFYQQRDRPEIGRSYMRQAVAAAEAWRAAEPQNPRARSALVDGLLNLSNAALWTRDHAAARAELVRARELCEPWLRSEPDDEEVCHLLSTVFDVLGGIDESEGNDREAVASYLRALELSMKLEQLAESARRTRKGAARHPARRIRNVMVSQHNLAMMYVRLRELTAARPQMDAALRRGRQLATADPENLQSQLDLVDAIFSRAAIEMADLRHPDAAPFLTECEALLKELNSRGQLEGRPIYSIERREAVDRDLRLCRALPAALADEAALWKSPGDLVPMLARIKIATLLKDHRLDEAVRTGRTLLAYEPKHARGWLELARTCAQSADALAQGRTGGPAADLASSLLGRGVESLRRFIDRRDAADGDAWQHDEQLVALRRHPGFAALTSAQAGGASQRSP